MVQAASEKEIIPLFSSLAPAAGAVANAAVGNERWFAMLRTIVALRLYAAAHGGQGPKQLQEVSEAPVPNDPLSGKPFIYRVEGDKAVLDAPLLPGMPQRHFGKRYSNTYS